MGLSKFARNCQPDALLEIPDEMQKERYCFPAKGKLTGAQCCEAQTRFADTVARLQADLGQRSLSGALDSILFLPLKIFFVLIVVAIAICLAIWRDSMDTHYLELVPAVERGVIIGAFAMLFWPLMDYGYQQTSNALYGRWGTGPQFRLSLVIVPWALLLLFYFLRRLRKNLEIVGQLAGVAASAIAILRYEEINDWSVRLFGAGADNGPSASSSASPRSASSSCGGRFACRSPSARAAGGHSTRASGGRASSTGCLGHGGQTWCGGGDGSTASRSEPPVGHAQPKPIPAAGGQSHAGPAALKTGMAATSGSGPSSGLPASPAKHRGRRLTSPRRRWFGRCWRGMVSMAARATRSLAGARVRTSNCGISDDAHGLRQRGWGTGQARGRRQRITRHHLARSAEPDQGGGPSCRGGAAIAVPTREEMAEIEASSRLYQEGGATT